MLAPWRSVAPLQVGRVDEAMTVLNEALRRQQGLVGERQVIRVLGLDPLISALSQRVRMGSRVPYERIRFLAKGAKARRIRSGLGRPAFLCASFPARSGSLRVALK